MKIYQNYKSNESCWLSRSKMPHGVFFDAVFIAQMCNISSLMTRQRFVHLMTKFSVFHLKSMKITSIGDEFVKEMFC